LKLLLRNNHTTNRKTKIWINSLFQGVFSKKTWDQKIKIYNSNDEKYFQSIDKVFFPETCISCHKTGEYLCYDCKKELVGHPEICPYCHRISKEYQTCLDCKISKQNALEGVIIAFSYSNSIKKLIVNFKYKHQKNLANFLAKRLVVILKTNQKLEQYHKEKRLFLCPIPSHRYRKHFIKGYNQSEILVEEISKETTIPSRNLLEKTQATKTQAHLQRNQRLVNLKGKFWIRSHSEMEGNETIILIDDISTTNSTLNEAALSIKNHYPQVKIRGLVLARHN
jgi:competence protein ComFC